MQIDSTAIANRIRKTVIFEGLELEETGLALEEIADDTLLFDPCGLGLDSVDGLEIIAGVQREFGFTLGDVDQAFMVERCATVQKLTTLVIECMPRTVA